MTHGDIKKICSVDQFLKYLQQNFIKKDCLQGKGEARLRNGEVKEDKWSSLLSYLLSNKTVTTTIPIMNKVRNGFTMCNRETTVEEFCYFVHYFPKITNEVPNKETFVQNFIEYAFITDKMCRIFLSYYADYYMALINQSYQIAQRIIKFIVNNKDSGATCGKLCSMLSEEVIGPLKLKEKNKH